jgi:maleate isomerase
MIQPEESMYGYRAKIGLLVPSTNTVLEADFWRLAPPGVSVHAARMRLDLRLDPVERLTLMAEHAAEVVVDLAMANPSVIVFGVTSGSFYFGRAADAARCADLERRAGRHVISTSAAVVAAMHALEMARVCVVTPYADDLNVALPPYLAEHGIEVVAMSTGETDRPDRVTAAEILSLARESWHEGADGLFISCTGLPTLDLIAPLEAELGTRVVTSNQASAWAAFDRAGVRDAHAGFGQLLAECWTGSR